MKGAFPEDELRALPEGIRRVKSIALDVPGLGAERHPVAFLLDSEHKIRYEGRIDNSYSERIKKHPQVTRQDLRQVLGELLSGRPVAEPATVAIGCAIARETKALAKEGKVTYHRDVAPIMQKHCQECHRPGEVGPFSLLKYEDAARRADFLASITAERRMPPWKATGHLG